MARVILSIIAGALLGAFGTKFILQKVEQEHRHGRSVMTLLSFHQERLDNAAKAGACADVATEQVQLVALQREIALAFPKAYKQEEGFRKDAEALGTTLATPATVDGACADAPALAHKVGEACDTCHKTYDPA